MPIQKSKETKEKTPKKDAKKTKALSEKEYEKLVLDLASKGLTSEKIGQELKNQGIHPGKYNKKISAILKENDNYVNPDLKNVSDKLERIKIHYEKNKQDKRAMREKDRVFAHVRKLKKYFRITK